MLMAVPGSGDAASNMSSTLCYVAPAPYVPRHGSMNGAAEDSLVSSAAAVIHDKTTLDTA
jgi:hypothetical protein